MNAPSRDSTRPATRESSANGPPLGVEITPGTTNFRASGALPLPVPRPPPRSRHPAIAPRCSSGRPGRLLEPGDDPPRDDRIHDDRAQPEMSTTPRAKETIDRKNPLEQRCPARTLPIEPQPRTAAQLLRSALRRRLRRLRLRPGDDLLPPTSVPSQHAPIDDLIRPRWGANRDKAFYQF